MGTYGPNVLGSLTSLGLKFLCLLINFLIHIVCYKCRVFYHCKQFLIYISFPAVCTIYNYTLTKDYNLFYRPGFLNQLIVLIYFNRDSFLLFHGRLYRVVQSSFYYFLSKQENIGYYRSWCLILSFTELAPTGKFPTCTMWELQESPDLVLFQVEQGLSFKTVLPKKFTKRV